MASPELAVSKAAFSASLFKADPTSLSRQEVEVFFPLLNATIAKCSRHNVQTCKNWIMAHVASSSARCAGLAKYLVALSKSFLTNVATCPSLKRKRLHILYLLSDVLHHSVIRNSSRVCADAWSTHLIALVAAAASFENSPKHKNKLDILTLLWSEKQYFVPQIIAQIRDAVANNGKISFAVDSEAKPSTVFNTAKDAPYMLPWSHGDSSTPWYDLPAATWYPHLKPNLAQPMKPELIRPIQLSSGPPDTNLISAIKNLIGTADRIFTSKYAGADGAFQEVNELGERVAVDEISGDVLSGDTYYGWSRQFCEKMKARQKSKNESRTSAKDSRSRSYTPSRSSRSRSVSHGRLGSLSPSRKRPRRYSSDSRSRSRSYSRSRNRTPPSRRHRSHNRSLSQGSSGNRSRGRNYSRDRSYSRNHSRSRSRSTTRNERQKHWRKSPSRSRQHRPAAASDFEHMPLSTPPPPPPPPPVGFQGHWPPPPPPPLLPGGMPHPAVMGQMMAAWQGAQAGFPIPPPPPPPPPPLQPRHQNSRQQRGGYYNQQAGYNQGGGYHHTPRDDRRAYTRNTHSGGGYNNSYSSRGSRDRGWSR